MEYTFVEGSLSSVLESFEKYTTVGLDLETTGLNPIDSRILLCQLAFEGGEAFVIDARKVDLSPLVPFFANKKWTKVIHNAKFEAKFLLHYYGVRFSGIFDTYLAEQVLIPGGSRNGLDDVALKYTGVVLDKSVRKSFFDMRPERVFTKEQLDYAADDATVMFGIKNEQTKLLLEANLMHIAQLEFDVAPIVAEMEETGIPILKDKWKKILAEYVESYEQSSQRMYSLLFDETTLAEQIGMFERAPINLRSPKQLLEAMQKIGIDIKTTNESDIAKIDHPVAKELLVLREKQKVIDTYGETFLAKIHPFTGRIHPDFNQVGTETGRFSCREPNVQQIPPEFRACVGDPENYSIVVADYGQFELRVLAEFSKDRALIKAFQSGADPHKATASLMFRVPLDSVTKDQRYLAKTLNFGMVYGMGARKLMDTLNEKIAVEKDKIGITKARQLLNLYKETYSTAIRWIEAEGNVALRTGSVKTLYGRKRYFNRPKFIDQESYDKQVGAIRRAGANAPIQGSNADITKLAMIKIYDELNTYFSGAKIIIQVHDEIVVLAQKSQAEAVKDLVVDAMIKAAETLIKAVPITVDAGIHEDWEK